MFSEEKKRLENIGKTFTMESGLTKKVEKYFVEKLKENLGPGQTLEIGCADGYLAKNLAKFTTHIIGIDGSKKLIGRAKKRKIKNATFIHSLFEEYSPEIKFDYIILCDILEHVIDPINLLKMSKTWLKHHGKILIISPNAYSVHRRIGSLSGMIKDVHELNATDLRVGHRRVYDSKLLKKSVKKAGLKVVKEDGFFLKPLSDSQLDKLSDEVINAFYLIGKQVPYDLLALLYFVCKK